MITGGKFMALESFYYTNVVGPLRTNPNDYNSSGGAGANVSISGGYIVFNGTAANCNLSLPASRPGSSYSDFAYKAVITIGSFQFDVAPSASTVSVITYFSGYAVAVNSSKQLAIVSGSTWSTVNAVGSTVLAVATNYRIELLIDQDWNGYNQGSVRVRLNGVDEVHFDTNASIYNSGGFSLGTTYNSGGKGGSGAAIPGTTNKVKNIVTAFASVSARGNRTPWLGSQTVDSTLRVPIANGSHSDFTGSPNTGVNKYQNVDENPASDTDYNYGGSVGSTLSETDTFTNVASYSGTIRAINVTSRYFLSAGALENNYYSLIKTGGVDYTGNPDYLASGSAGTDYGIALGYSRKPSDGSAWTASDLNSLEGGDQVISTGSNPQMKVSAVWLEVATGDAFTDNGTVPQPVGKLVNIKQAVNRGGTY